MPDPDSKVEAILSRFPGPVTLYPSRKKWLLLLVGGGLFATGGIFMVRDHAEWGWFVLIFFGLCTVAAAVMLMPGSSGLTLDADGFEITNFFQRYRLRWQDVKGFEPVSISHSTQKLVGFDHTALTGNAFAKMNVAIAGHNAALPDTYGLSADDLARLMTQWQTRARAST